MIINLTTFCSHAAKIPVMEHKGLQGFFVGTVADHFGTRLTLIHVGDSQGADSQRGAYEWWPLTIDGDVVAELRDDADGMTVHVDA